MKFLKIFIFISIYYILINSNICLNFLLRKNVHFEYLICIKNSTINFIKFLIKTMANFIKPYNDDPFVGHLATPITSSSITKTILKNLPAYRSGLTPLLRGLEIGLAHGYFLIGPFVKLGPLRNSDVALVSGFLSSIGLIVILTLGLTIYGIATFGQAKTSQQSEVKELQTKKAWEQFKGGFFVGACGSTGFAAICLSSIPLFNI
jgi:photosystem I subunit 11